MRFPPLLLAAALAAGCSRDGAVPAKPSAAAPGSRSYRVATRPVASRPLEYAFEAVGSLEAFDVVAVPSRVAGTVESLSFDEGDVVATDRVLVVVDGKRYALELDQARAALGRTEASVESARARTGQAAAALKEAEAGLGRRKALRERNAGWVTADEITTLEAAVARAKAALEEAAANEKVAAAQVDEGRSLLAMAQKNADDARVRPPLAGIVERRHVSGGQFVQPGDPVATIVDLSRLRLRFRVGEAESVQVRPGQEVAFRTAAFAGREFRATVFHVKSVAEAATRMVECLAEVKSPDPGLRPGFFATVRIVVSRAEGAIVVPEESILPTEKGFTAFVVVDGKAAERPVRLGLHTRDGGVEVLSGLAAGEALVVAGAQSLSEGVPVTVAAPETKE